MTHSLAMPARMRRAAWPRRDGTRPALGWHFDDPGFRAALREMQALGLRVTVTPHAGSQPYDVLAGHAHQRWFLLPPRPHDVSIAALALVQPVRPAARGFKLAVVGAVRLGLPHLWRHGRVHVSGTQMLARGFDPGATQAAFLTGTAGLHRKLTVQLMDARGGIHGYAKVSRVPAVQRLLANEASVLGQLRGLALATAVVPRVLLHERWDGATVLATDTVRTPRHPCCIGLQRAHLAFLDELATRTASFRVPDGSAVLRRLRVQAACLPAALPFAWRQRFGRVLKALACAPELIAPSGLAHGDFTPGNTFRYAGRLCVFDWEYAGYGYPADYDLIHFLFAAHRVRREPSAERAFAVESTLVRDFGRPPAAARARLAAYLCANALLLAGRQARQGGEALTWEGESAAALMLDAMDGRGRIAR